MRYIIYGAGAVGGTIGGRLFQHGHDVVLIARGAHLDKIQASGLLLEDPNASALLPIPAVSDPAEISFGPDDVVLLTMKSQDTLPALSALRNAAGSAVPVICCQNGVCNEHFAARMFESVYAMVVILPATHLEPGTVLHEATSVGGILDAGVFPAGIDERITEVTNDLTRANFSALPDSRVMRQKYAKLLMNLGNSLQAVSEAGADARGIASKMVHEAVACFEAAGIDCASREETRARRGDLIRTGSIKGRSRGGGSSWQSILRGTGSIESDFLNGEIVYLGKLHGVPTPANSVLQQLGNQVAQRGAGVGSIPLSEVEGLIAEAEAQFEAL